jgi:Transglycosylase SLT domain
MQAFESRSREFSRHSELRHSVHQPHPHRARELHSQQYFSRCPLMEHGTKDAGMNWSVTSLLNRTVRLLGIMGRHRPFFSMSRHSSIRTVKKATNSRQWRRCSRSGGWQTLILGLFMVAVFPVSGLAQLMTGSPPALLCRLAIGSVEQSTGIPDHLLAAIGQVETGRRDPETGNWHPWPWTINAEGRGYFYETKAQAIAAVRTLQARGVQSIDVGCMQVNLRHHPNAFATLEQAFEPQANVVYAARFLTQLFGQSGSWAKAAALYHSATPELGAEYQRRVLAVWPEEKQHQEARRREQLREAQLSALARAWAATLSPTSPNSIASKSPIDDSDDVHFTARNRTKLRPSVRGRLLG